MSSHLHIEQEINMLEINFTQLTFFASEEQSSLKRRKPKQPVQTYCLTL